MGSACATSAQIQPFNVDAIPFSVRARVPEVTNLAKCLRTARVHARACVLTKARENSTQQGSVHVNAPVTTANNQISTVWAATARETSALGV